MFYLIKLTVLLISVCVVKTTHSCVCTQPLNPQFLCVDEECVSEDSLIHHYCNSNYVIKIMIISDRIFSAIPGSFSTRVGYKYKLVHAYKLEKGRESILDSNIIWTPQDSCGVAFKKGRLYIITGNIDKDSTSMRTSTCDFVKPVKDLKINDINFFGYSHKQVNCSQIDQAEAMSPDLEDSYTPETTQTNEPQIKEIPKKHELPKITTRPVMQDKSCYCGPTLGSALNSVNIGLGAANNNGENGWNNVEGGLNIAIASGNGNNGHGIGTRPNENKCVLYEDGTGNGNGGVNIGIGSGNFNGGHGWNVGNGGNNVETHNGNGNGGGGGHNVGGDSGNGKGGKNIGIISGNNNAQNGWNIGNGGNNADDNTMNSEVYAEPGGHPKGQGDNFNLGHGGNNVGDNSGNGNGGENWGLWSGNDNGFHGWHTGNGGNNAGDNVGNGHVILANGQNEEEFVAHNSAIGGNNRGNNTGNGKGGSLQGFGSGLNNGMSSWNSGNGGNNVGNHSGSGLIGNGLPTVQRRPGPGRKPGIWTSGVGNGGNNIGSNSGNGLGSTSEIKEVMNGFILGIESKFKDKNKEKPEKKDEFDKNHLKTLMDEIEAENNLDRLSVL